MNRNGIFGATLIDLNRSDYMELLLRIDPELWSHIEQYKWLDKIDSIAPSDTAITHEVRNESEAMYLKRSDGVICLGVGKNSGEASQKLYESLAFASSCDVLNSAASGCDVLESPA